MQRANIATLATQPLAVHTPQEDKVREPHRRNFQSHHIVIADLKPLSSFVDAGHVVSTVHAGQSRNTTLCYMG